MFKLFKNYLYKVKTKSKNLNLFIFWYNLIILKKTKN